MPRRPTWLDQLAQHLEQFAVMADQLGARLEFNVVRIRPATRPADWPVARRRPRRMTPTARAAARVEIAARLAQFDPHVPTRPQNLPVKVQGLTALVRQGYLRRQGAGYVRTAKPFHVDP